MQLQQLDPRDPAQAFPPVTQALRSPNGLLAVGGCLAPQRILNAYRVGIFPWFSPQEPILWWSPNPRMVVFPEHLIVSRSLHKTLRQQRFLVTYDRAFVEVMSACAQPRTDQAGTWISPEMLEAYTKLHQLGHAHSIEAWQEGELVGGLYGIALGQVFFGESMFHRCRDASKVAFVHLVQHLQNWGYQLIDCQVASPHLASLGAEDISRSRFSALLEQHCNAPISPNAWLP